MPATAGRVRMPADNRLSVSASLKTSEIWQKSVGYDPYAPAEQSLGGVESLENSEKAKGLFALARLTGASSSVTPGTCKKCGEVGHLSFQCRNTIQLRKETTIRKPTLSEVSAEDEDEEKVGNECHFCVALTMRRLYGLESDDDKAANSSSSKNSSSNSSNHGRKRRRSRKVAKRETKRRKQLKEVKKSQKQKESHRSKHRKKDR
ncbi:putative nucleic acid binding protein [Cardiosporidium cionae]|uniref:Nucleic acid binding protein n=1 Tax=Cardiosporidium cionae TaxID=476202 RepID=A0ABQ7J8I5_9APIC|nr:putative nucleic acid binding protein [Cardiosporidium cionae]|eukprot:KAF8820312.1 putative nucleic acid binding protein [Cardiosporidium cionae]